MANDFPDADPEEFVVVVGLGPMTLQTAVRMWAAASKVPGALIAPVAREAGKDPATFEADDLDRLAEMERFHRLASATSRPTTLRQSNFIAFRSAERSLK